jgi:thioredoxin 1
MKTLLYYTADWCGPCKMMAPIITELQHKYSIRKIDIDQSPESARQYSVMSIPTFILVDNGGNEITRLVGAQSKSMLENLLK